MQVRCFDQFDEFAASIGHVQSRMLYRNPARRLWRLAMVDVDRLAIQYGELGSGNLAQAEIEAGGYLLYVPLTPGIEYVANGTAMEEDSSAILEPGAEACVSTKIAHDWAGIFVPLDVLAAVDDHLGPLTPIETPTVRVTPANRPLAARFRSALRNIMTTAAACPQFARRARSRQGAAGDWVDHPGLPTPRRAAPRGAAQDSA